MAKQDSGAKQELDEHGLVIQRYKSTVLVVVPNSDFAEETLRYARSSLYNVHVGTWSVAQQTDQMLKGRLQDEFLPDGALAGTSLAPYSGVLYVGGAGARSLTNDPDALRLAREAAAAGKLIGAWGEAVEILAAAGVLRGRKVTGAPGSKAKVQAAGGKYTGVQVERDGVLVTALDDAAGMRFGKALAQIVGIEA
jgi:putative intracellular protease/amidase